MLPTSADQKWKQIRLRVLQQIDDSSEDGEKHSYSFNKFDQVLSCHEALVLPSDSMSRNKENIQSEEQHDVSRIVAMPKWAAVSENLYAVRDELLGHLPFLFMIFSDDVSRIVAMLKRAVVSEKLFAVHE